MTILYLGPERPDFEAFLAAGGDTVIRREDPLSIADVDSYHARPDWIISYGYRHRIKSDVIDPYRRRILNLHISYLPWNRGADPNLWSFLEDTPKGVSIHYLDEGLDTGPIVAQQRVDVSPGDTLRTMYAKLSAAMEELFRVIWPTLRVGRTLPIGNFHQVKDKAPYEHLFAERGWDTPVDQLRGKARANSDQPTVTIRQPLTLDECQLVREWRNDPAMLPLLRTGYKTAADQERFYREVVCNPNADHRYYAAMLDSTFIGMTGLTYFSREPGKAEISLMLGPSWRRQSLWSQTVDAVLSEAKRIGLTAVTGECYVTGWVDFWVESIRERPPFKWEWPV